MFSSVPVSRLSTQMHAVALGEEAIAQVRAEEARAAGDEGGRHGGQLSGGRGRRRKTARRARPASASSTGARARDATTNAARASSDFAGQARQHLVGGEVAARRQDDVAQERRRPRQ